MGKRKKDKAFHDLHETLSDLSYLVEDYLKALEVDLKTGEEVGSREVPSQDLKQKIDTAKALLRLIDETVWTQVMRVGGYSSAISHRRAGEFF